MAADDIGCSLAEAAESSEYAGYLEHASLQPNPGLHVVYINTSLRTKALSHAVVPTITCTSSNVVQTVLQVHLNPFPPTGQINFVPVHTQLQWPGLSLRFGSQW